MVIKVIETVIKYVLFVNGFRIIERINFRINDYQNFFVQIVHIFFYRKLTGITYYTTGRECLLLCYRISNLTDFQIAGTRLVLASQNTTANVVDVQATITKFITRIHRREFILRNSYKNETIVRNSYKRK